MRMSDWSSDVCSSDLIAAPEAADQLGIPDELYADGLYLSERYARGAKAEQTRGPGPWHLGPARIRCPAAHDHADLAASHGRRRTGEPCSCDDAHGPSRRDLPAGFGGGLR